ncbi:MAG TPA: twin-arginine translocase TatA/TatE family subunit [Opitutaceae bacterium]|jgi:sec-independent protein translocase protein TatA|nr:twin-arginine translocase TatA/TatE family subunit [Opitutaceae bacterium]
MHSSYLALFGLGGGELIAILVVVVLLFGGSKLPELARGLGLAKKEFKKASQEDSDEDKAKAAEAKKPEPAKTNSSN